MIIDYHPGVLLLPKVIHSRQLDLPQNTLNPISLIIFVECSFQEVLVVSLRLHSGIRLSLGIVLLRLRLVLA